MMHTGGSRRACRPPWRALLIACVIAAALASAPAASAAGSYISGPVQTFESFDCTTFVDSGGQDLLPAIAAQGWLEYQGSPSPTTGSVYYIAIEFDAGTPTLNSNGTCSASQQASLQLGLPPNTSLAISAATPIVCASTKDSGGSPQTFTSGCPTSAGTGTATGYYKFDPPGNSNYVWTVDDGYTLQVDVPVTSSAAMTNATNKSCTSSSQGCAIGFERMWDGFSSPSQPWVVYPTEGITVASGSTGTQPSVNGESTSNITDDSATMNATVNNQGKGGSAVAELFKDTSNGACSTLTNEVNSNPVTLTTSTNGVPITTNFTGLSASTHYCWREVFTPTGSSAVNGSYVAFATAAAATYTPPTFSSMSTSGVTSTSATANVTVAYHAAGSTETQAGTDSSSGSCTSPANVQNFDVTPVSGTSGSTTLATDLTGLSSGTYYCWREVFTPSDPGHAASDSSWVSFRTNIVLYHLTIQYANPATQNIQQFSAEGVVTVYNGHQAGTTEAELGTAVSGSCSSPANVTPTNEQGTSASAASTSVTTTFSDLKSVTTYCWRQIYTPAGGSETDGAWQPFTTKGFILLPQVPISSAPPTISGSLAVGQTLTETHGTWSGSPTSYAYQWSRCDATGAACSTISGATQQSYVLQPFDQGHTLVVAETASNSHGSGGAVNSHATGVVQRAETGPPVSSGAPGISGAAVTGQTLTASAGTWTGAAPMAYAYQWERCASSCAPIGGATHQSYVPVTADVGKKLELLVTASNSAGHASANSLQTAPVASLSRELAAALRSVLRPSGKPARLKSVAKAHGFTFNFTAPAGGTLTLTWYELPKGAHIARKVKPVKIASGKLKLTGSGVTSLRIVLSGAGKQLLKHAHHVKLTSRATFKAAGISIVTATGTFSLH